MKRGIIGLTVDMTVRGKTKQKKVKAKIDTGADKSSIDTSLALQLSLGPVIKTREVRSAHGRTVRPVIKTKIRINRKELTSYFTIADREHMKYKVLIGKNTLRKMDVLIDPKIK